MLCLRAGIQKTIVVSDSDSAEGYLSDAHTVHCYSCLAAANERDSIIEIDDPSNYDHNLGCGKE